MSSTTAPAEVALRAEGLHKEYRDGDRKLAVLKGASLEVRAGEFISIIGQSGSGKSTLLHLLGALDRATKGTVELSGRRYDQLSDSALAKLRSREIGFVYQFHHLLPEFTALENVLMPGLIARVSQTAALQRAEELLRQVGLGERLHHRPSKLSGGEQQRVAIARAVLNNPTLILADEPTGNLDVRTSGEVLQFLVDITVNAGKCLIMVTHDPLIAAKAHRHFQIVEGHLKES